MSESNGYLGTRRWSWSTPKDGTAVVLLAGLAWYVLMIYRAQYQTSDSLSYAVAARTAEQLYHSHHPLFSAAVRLVYLILSPLGLGEDVILAGQIHNAFWAAVGLAGFYLCLSMWTGSRLAGGAGALVLFGWQGIPYFATQVETYVPATACAAVMVLLIARGQASSSPFKLKPALALALAAFILYHQTNVLLVVPLAVFIFGPHKGRSLRAYAAILGLAGICVLAVYIVGYIVTGLDDPNADFLRYCLRYSLVAGNDWGTFAHFSSAGVNDLAAAQLSNLVLLSDQFANTGSVIIAVIATLVLGWNLVTIAIQRSLVAVRAFCIVWLAVNFLFFLWWLPEEEEFFVTTLIPLTLLLCLFLDDMLRWPVIPEKIQSAVWVAVAAAALFLLLPWHVRHTLEPLRNDKGLGYRMAADLNELMPDECIVFCQNRVLHPLRYYFGVPVSRSDGIKRTRNRFLYRETYPNIPPLERAVSLIVPFDRILPRKTEGVRDPFSHPAEWEQFLYWFFRLDSKDGRMTSPILSTGVDARGHIYLLQDRERSTVDGIPGLCRQLDGLLSRVKGVNQQPFMRWSRMTAARRTNASK